MNLELKSHKHSIGENNRNYMTSSYQYNVQNQNKEIIMATKRWRQYDANLGAFICWLITEHLGEEIELAIEGLLDVLRLPKPVLFT